MAHQSEDKKERNPRFSLRSIISRTQSRSSQLSSEQRDARVPLLSSTATSIISSAISSFSRLSLNRKDSQASLNPLFGEAREGDLVDGEGSATGTDGTATAESANQRAVDSPEYDLHQPEAEEVVDDSVNGDEGIEHITTTDQIFSERPRKISNSRDSTINDEIQTEDSSRSEFGIDGFVESEFLHPENEELQTQAVGALRKHLSRLHDAHQHIVDVMKINNVLDRLVHLMGNAKSQRLRHEAAWSLTNIASGTSEFTIQVAQSGALQVAKTILETKEEDLLVHDQVIWMVSNIAGDSYSLRDQCLELGLMSAVLPFLKPEFSSSHRQSSWCVSNFCRGKPSPDLELVEGCIEPVIALIKNSSDVDDVKNDCYFTLSYITDGANSRIERVLQAPGVVSLVVDELSSQCAKLESGRGQEMCLTPALRFAGNVVTGTDAETQQMVDGDLHKVVVRLLNASPATQVRKESWWLLSNIAAGVVIQIDALVDARVFELALDLLEDEVEDVKKEICWTISNALDGGTDNVKRKLLMMGGLGKILHASSTENTVTHEQIATMLSQLWRCFEIYKDDLPVIDIQSGFLRCLLSAKVSGFCQSTTFEGNPLGGLYGNFLDEGQLTLDHVIAHFAELIGIYSPSRQVPLLPPVDASGIDSSGLDRDDSEFWNNFDTEGSLNEYLNAPSSNRFFFAHHIVSYMLCNNKHSLTAVSAKQLLVHCQNNGMLLLALASTNPSKLEEVRNEFAKQDKTDQYSSEGTLSLNSFFPTFYLLDGKSDVDTEYCSAAMQVLATHPLEFRCEPRTGWGLVAWLYTCKRIAEYADPKDLERVCGYISTYVTAASPLGRPEVLYGNCTNSSPEDWLRTLRIAPVWFTQLCLPVVSESIHSCIKKIGIWSEAFNGEEENQQLPLGGSADSLRLAKDDVIGEGVTEFLLHASFGGFPTASGERQYLPTDIGILIGKTWCASL